MAKVSSGWGADLTPSNLSPRGPTMFVIKDEKHADFVGEFDSREDAIVELRRFAETPWDQEPNVAPCTN